MSFLEFLLNMCVYIVCVPKERIPYSTCPFLTTIVLGWHCPPNDWISNCIDVPFSSELYLRNMNVMHSVNTTSFQSFLGLDFVMTLHDIVMLSIQVVYHACYWCMSWWADIAFYWHAPGLQGFLWKLSSLYSSKDSTVQTLIPCPIFYLLVWSYLPPKCHIWAIRYVTGVMESKTFHIYNLWYTMGLTSLWLCH